jgi:cation:H+ antiporter
VILKAQFLALYFGLSITFVGFFIIAVGTSLPELVFSLKAIRKHHPGMVTASIIGSCITNATLIVGISAIIQPIIFTGQLGIVYLSGLEYFFILSLFVLFITTKKRLDSWEGIILILIYAYYSNLELLIK